MLNETFSVIFKHRGVGWGRYWNVNGDVALVHFGQPNIRPEAEMWLPAHEPNLYAVEITFIFCHEESSVSAWGYWVFKFNSSRTEEPEEKWPWTDTPRKTTQWTTAWQKIIPSVDQELSEKNARCLKITEKSLIFNIASEASYVYILSGQKFF